MTAEGGEPLSDTSTVLECLDALTERLGDVAGQLATVADAFIRTRRQGVRVMVGLSVSLVLDVALTVVVTLLSLGALSQASAVHTSQLAACAIGNESRAAQTQLWNYVIQLSGPPKTPAEAEKDRQFIAYVNKTFAQVNCAQFYK